MSMALKIGIGCLVLVVVFVAVAGGGGYYWWRNYGAGMVEGMKQTDEEGREYGRDADEWKCVNEAVGRYKGTPGITSAIKTRIFLKSCLQSSGAAVGFCEGVPRRGELTRAREWQTERCEQAGLSGDDFCRQLFEEVQDYCESGAARAKQRPAASPEWEESTPTPTPRRRAPR